MAKKQQNGTQKLWKALNDSGYYTKSYDDFSSQFSTPEQKSKLYNALNKAGYYTKSSDEFNRQFFFVQGAPSSQDSASGAQTSTEPLSASQENDFKKWYSEVAKYKGLDPNPDDPNHFYDYRTFYKNEPELAKKLLTDDPDAHFTDIGKKPGHPTFSDESIYFNESNRNQAGSWDGDTYIPFDTKKPAINTLTAEEISNPRNIPVRDFQAPDVPEIGVQNLGSNLTQPSTFGDITRAADQRLAEQEAVQANVQQQMPYLQDQTVARAIPSPLMPDQRQDYINQEIAPRIEETNRFINIVNGDYNDPMGPQGETESERVMRQMATINRESLTDQGKLSYDMIAATNSLKILDPASKKRLSDEQKDFMEAQRRGGYLAATDDDRGYFNKFIGTPVSNFGTAVGREGTRLIANIMGIPEYANDVVAGGINGVISMLGGDPDFIPTWEETYGDTPLDQYRNHLMGAVERNVAKNTARYGDAGIWDSIKSGNIDAAANKLSDAIGGMLPFTAMLMATGGSGTGMMLGTGAVASGQYSDTEESDMTQAARLLNSTINGIAETGFESIGNKFLLEPLVKTVKGLGKEAGKEAVERTVNTALQKYLGKFYPLAPPLIEITTEVGTTIANNITAIATGEDPDRKWNDGVDDTIITSAAFSAPTQAASSAIIGINNKKNLKEAQRLNEENADIESFLENEELTQEERDLLSEKYRRNISKINNYIVSEQQRKANLSPAQKSIVDEAEARKARLTPMLENERLPESVRKSIQNDIDAINDEIEQTEIRSKQTRGEAKKRVTDRIKELESKDSLTAKEELELADTRAEWNELRKIPNDTDLPEDIRIDVAAKQVRIEEITDELNKKRKERTITQEEDVRLVNERNDLIQDINDAYDSIPAYPELQAEEQAEATTETIEETPAEPVETTDTAAVDENIVKNDNKRTDEILSTKNIFNEVYDTPVTEYSTITLEKAQQAYDEGVAAIDEVNKSNISRPMKRELIGYINTFLNGIKQNEAKFKTESSTRESIKTTTVEGVRRVEQEAVPREPTKTPKTVDDAIGKEVFYKGERGRLRVGDDKAILFESQDGTTVELPVGSKNTRMNLSTVGVEPYVQPVLSEDGVVKRGGSYVGSLLSINKDDSGNVVSYTVKNNNGQERSIRDPEEALDVAIQEQHRQLGAIEHVPTERFSEIFNEMVSEVVSEPGVIRDSRQTKNESPQVNVVAENEAESGQYFTRDIGGEQTVYRRNEDGTASIVPDTEAQYILSQQDAIPTESTTEQATIEPTVEPVAEPTAEQTQEADATTGESVSEPLSESVPTESETAVAPGTQGQVNENTPTTQPEVPAEQTDTNPTAKSGDSLRLLADKIRQGKISKLGGYRASTGFDGAWDLGLEAIALALEGGANIADAIEAGLKKVRQTKWYHGLADKKKFDKDFRSHMRDQIGVNESVPESKSTPEKKTTGITKEELSATREGLGLEQYRKQVKKDAELQRQAQSELDKGYNIERLITRMENRELPTDVEQTILKIYLSSLEADNNANPTPEKLKNIDRISRVIRTGSEELGRALRATKGTVLVQDNLSNFLMEEAMALGTDTLPQEMINDLKEKFDAGIAAKEAYEAGYKKAMDEFMAKRASKEVDKARNTARGNKKKTREDYAKERSAIRDSIRAKLKKARGQANAVPVPYLKELIDISPDVARLMRSYVEEGINNLADIIDRIHDDISEDIPDITKTDVRDLIGGKYNMPSKTRPELAEQVRDLKTQAKLLERIEKLESGIRNEKDKVKKIRRSKEVEELYKQIAEIQKRQSEEENRFNEPKEVTYEQKLKSRATWLKNRIAQLQADLENGNFMNDKPEPVRLKLDPETQRLQDEYIKFLKETNLRRDKARYENKSMWRKAWDRFVEVLGLRRIIQSSLDWSMPFRQAVTVTLNPRYAKTTYRSFINMAKSTFNDKYYDRMMFRFQNNPEYKEMVQDGLILSEVDSIDNMNREEDFRTSFLYKIPYLRQLFLGSNRAAAGYVNTARMEIYHKFTNNLINQGINRQNNPKAYKYAADWAMAMTGRGRMIDAFENNKGIQEILGDTFYGARLMASRFQLLNPNFYRKMPKEVRVQALKDIVSYASTATVVAFAAIAAGATVSLNPDDPDFLKAKWGNRRYDLFSGGINVYLRTAFRIIKAAAMRANPALYGAEKDLYQLKKANSYGMYALSSSLNFFRNKLAPNTGDIVSMFTGKTPTGDEFDASSFWTLTPMYYDELMIAMKDEDAFLSSMGIMVPELLGIGTQMYDDRGKRTGYIREFRDNGKNYVLSDQQTDLYKQLTDDYKRDAAYELEIKKEDLIFEGNKKNEAELKAKEWFEKRARDFAKKEILRRAKEGDFRLVED